VMCIFGVIDLSGSAAIVVTPWNYQIDIHLYNQTKIVGFKIDLNPIVQFRTVNCKASVVSDSGANLIIN
jgi:hypothetical protein